MGEQKHKIFKQHAPHTNSKENDLQLLQAINISQTLRYTIDGMYHRHPQWGLVSSVLQDVLTACPRLREFIVGKATPSKPLNLTPVAEKATVEYAGSLFEYARVGKPIAARDHQRSDDSAKLAKAYHTLYGINAELLSKWTIRYRPSFTGIASGEKQKIYSGRTIMKVTSRGSEEEMDQQINTFALIKRIFTIDVGQISRVIFEVILLRRSTEEEHWSAPYAVYSLMHRNGTPIDLSFISIDSLVPGRYHFVSKVQNRSWYWNHLVIHTI